MNTFEQLSTRDNADHPSFQCDDIFLSSPTATIIYDNQETIVGINPAALSLFEIDADTSYIGTSIHQFIRHYQIRDHRRRFFRPATYTQRIQSKKHSHIQEKLVQSEMPSRDTVNLQVSCAPVFNAQHQFLRMMCIFNTTTILNRRISHIQNLYIISLFNLMKAIISVPDLISVLPQQESLLLPAPIRFIEQQLIDVIRQLLEAQWAFFIAIEPPDNRNYYAAISGLQPKQIQRRENSNGKFTLSDFLNQHDITLLQNNEPLTISHDRVHLPFIARSKLAPLQMLWVPLFLEGRLAGIFIIAKPSIREKYTPKEIALVQSVAHLVVQIIECIQLLSSTKATNARDLILQETHQQINAFLTLASHELRTPLTAIMGNIQLSLRRMDELKKRLTENADGLRSDIERIHQPLRDAEQGARLQNRMISNIIDDMHIQSNEFCIHAQRCDLLHILRLAIKQQRLQESEHRIALYIPDDVEAVPVFANPERITQVITTFLTSALLYSPAFRPVEIQLSIEGNNVRVSVHDQGPGIATEEREQVWTRFYRGKGQAPQHELDLSMGLSFYISREIIHRHHGEVGLNSATGEGTIFWFTIPLAQPPNSPQA